jgi:HK97 family phage prohead protease
MPAPQGKEWARDIPLEVKSVNAEAHTFRGLAAAWSLDLGNDVIHRGAFKHTLNMWKSARKPRPIYLLNGHKAGDVLDVVGKLVDAEETDEGLETTWEFVPNDPTAEAAFKRVQGGFITGLSIGYTPVQHDWETTKEGKRVRHLKEVKLHEVSLVVFPMNEDARIDMASVKTLAQWHEMDNEERKAYIATLSEDDRSALRALCEPAPEPGSEAAHEDTKEALRNALLRLTLHQAVSRISDPTSEGLNIAPTRMSNDGKHQPDERVAA